MTFLLAPGSTGAEILFKCCRERKHSSTSTSSLELDLILPLFYGFYNGQAVCIPNRDFSHLRVTENGQNFVL